MRHCLIFFSAFVLACGGGSNHVETSAPLDNRADPARVRAAPSDLLAYVDADALYVYASLEPLPRGLAERGMKALENAARPLYELIDMADESMFESPEERVLLAVASGLRDKLTVSGFRSLGIDIERPFVLYSVGVLPVLRLHLGDAAKLVRFVEETAARARIDVPRGRAGTTEYWAIPVNQHLVVAVAIQGSHLVTVLAPRRQPEPTVSRALDQARPSLAQSPVLPALRQRYDITMNMVGYMDFMRVFASLRDDADPFHVAQRQALLPDGTPGMSRACMDEIGALVAHMPRVVMGYRTLTARSSHAISVIETSQALGATLRSLVRPHPWLGREPMGRPLLSLSVGIDLGALIRELGAFAERPFGCEELRIGTAGLREAATQLRAPMVDTLVGGIVGVHLSVDDLVQDSGGTVEVQGHAILEHASPDSVVAMLGLMLGLSGLRDGAPPVTTPVPLPGGAQTLSMSRHGKTFVFSMGEGVHERVLTARGQMPGPDAPVMTVAYDEARAYRLAEDIPWLYELLDDRENRMLEDQDELARLRQVDAALASGFAYGTVWFRKDGIVVESISPDAGP